MGSQKSERGLSRRKSNKNGMRVHRIHEEQRRTRSGETLRESKEELEAIINQVRDGIVVLDLTGKIIKINKRITEATGYTEEDIIGKRFNLLKMFTPQSIAKMFFRFSKSLAGIEILPYEVEGYTKKGEKRIVEISSSLLRKNGKAAGVITVMRDITERKQAEMALRESEERFRKVVETMKVGLATVDENGILTYVNEYSGSMIGYSVDEMVGHDPTDFYYYEEGRKAQKEIFEKRRKGMREAPTHEVAWRTKDGRKVYSILTPTPIFDAEGRYKGSLAIHTDITERKRAEEALRESEERYKALYEDNPSMYFTVDVEGKVLSVNQYGAEQLCYKVEELVGQSAFDIFFDDDKEAVRRQLTTCIQNPTEVFHWEFRKVRKDGNVMWVKEAARAVRSVDNKLVVLIVCEDITKRKQAEEDLGESFEKLRRSLESTVMALASTIEMRDPYTAGHQQRVADLACAIAKEMGLSDEQIHGIRFAGLIHDIGKINIPAEILSRPGELKEIEFSLFKNHPRSGYDVLKTIEFPWPVAQIVLQHHERMDGSGYPQGLSGAQIIVEAKILAVADIVEAIATHRPYRPARGIGDALEEILHNKETFYDPEVVDACLRVFYEKGFTFE